jgi:hypothetical protein
MGRSATIVDEKPHEISTKAWVAFEALLARRQDANPIAEERRPMERASEDRLFIWPCLMLGPNLEVEAMRPDASGPLHK